MTLKSLLFVPGDSEKKLAKAASTGADALLLDLEDAVSQDRLPIARGLVLDYLKSHDRSSQQVWVRISKVSHDNASHSVGFVLHRRACVARCVIQLF